MTRTALLLALALLATGCSSSPGPSAPPPAPSGPASATASSPSGSTPSPSASTPTIGGPGADTVVSCSLPAGVCDAAVQAVEATPLDAAGMPPLAVTIVDMSGCATVAGAPKGYDPCAAALILPAEPGATDGGDGLATVTYRNGLGRAFLYVWWRTFPSGRGPVNAALEAHNP